MTEKYHSTNISWAQRVCHLFKKLDFLCLLALLACAIEKNNMKYIKTVHSVHISDCFCVTFLFLEKKKKKK